MLEPHHASLILALLNLIAITAFGIDKLLSKSSGRHISERTLLIISSLLASPGGILGMVLFNHKTSKAKFRYGMPGLLLVHALLGYWLTYY